MDVVKERELSKGIFRLVALCSGEGGATIPEKQVAPCGKALGRRSRVPFWSVTYLNCCWYFYVEMGSGQFDIQV